MTELAELLALMMFTLIVVFHSTVVNIGFVDYTNVLTYTCDVIQYLTDISRLPKKLRIHCVQCVGSWYVYKHIEQ